MSLQQQKNESIGLDISNPWEFEESNLTTKDRDLFLKKNFSDEKEVLNLQYILKDILNGDNDLRNRKEYSHLNFPAIRVALQWLFENNQIDETVKTVLLTDPWKLNFKIKPPAPKEFLTEKYIGPMVENLWRPIRRNFIDFFDPLRSWRTAVFCSSIGSGKSTLTCLIYAYIATCFAFMWSPHKMFNKLSTSQPLNCKVYKPNKKSYFYMGEVKPGDIIYSPTQKSSIVESIQYRGLQPTYEIEFDDGTKTKCSPDHLWTVSWERLNDKPVWKTIKTQYIIDHPEIDFNFFEDGDELISRSYL
jgi:hypothetical protein